MTLRLVLASAQVATRAGVRKVIEDTGLEVCAEVSDARSAVEAVCEHDADACLIDEVLPGDAILATAEMAARHPRTAVILLADSPTESQFMSALHVGASGYLDKDMNMDRLAAAVVDACKGVPAIPQRFMAALVAAFRAGSGKQRRELPPHVEAKLSG
jgi:DNA-binding NarL/FixJ family response regulator